MRKVVVVALLTLLAVGCGASQYTVGSWQYVQTERAALGLQPLEWDTALVPLAQVRAQEITGLGALDHGGAGAVSTALYGVRPYFCEVLGRQPVTAPVDSIGWGWIQSPGHAACVLGSQYKRAAVVCYLGTDDWVYCAAWLTD